METKNEQTRDCRQEIKKEKGLYQVRIISTRTEDTNANSVRAMNDYWVVKKLMKFTNATMNHPQHKIKKNYSHGNNSSTVLACVRDGSAAIICA